MYDIREVIGESLELPFLKGTLGCWRRTRTYLDEVEPYHRSRLDASELLMFKRYALYCSLFILMLMLLILGRKHPKI